MCTHINIYTHAHINTCIQALLIHVHKHILTHVHMHVCILTHVHMHILTHVHMHILTHVHMHVYILTQVTHGNTSIYVHWCTTSVVLNITAKPIGLWASNFFGIPTTAMDPCFFGDGNLRYFMNNWSLSLQCFACNLL